MKIYGTLDDGKPHLGSGTEFPANPIVGAIFEKTGDAFGPYYWNGTAWKILCRDHLACRKHQARELRLTEPLVGVH